MFVFLLSHMCVFSGKRKYKVDLLYKVYQYNWSWTYI